MSKIEKLVHLIEIRPYGNKSYPLRLFRDILNDHNLNETDIPDDWEACLSYCLSNTIKHNQKCVGFKRIEIEYMILAIYKSDVPYREVAKALGIEPVRLRQILFKIMEKINSNEKNHELLRYGLDGYLDIRADKDLDKDSYKTISDLNSQISTITNDAANTFIGYEIKDLDLTPYLTNKLTQNGITYIDDLLDAIFNKSIYSISKVGPVNRKNIFRTLLHTPLIDNDTKIKLRNIAKREKWFYD